jgi:hypothetical protein
MRYCFTLYACFLTLISFAQAPQIQWMKRYGGSSLNLLGSLIRTQDGGLMLGGSSNSGISGIKTEARIGENPDYWVIKTDISGNVQWQKTIGGGDFIGELAGEVLLSVRQSTDGSYFLGGYSDSPVFGLKTSPNYGESDYWIVKINAVGTILWQTSIGGSSYDFAYPVELTKDGGCIIGGETWSGISGNKTEANKGGKDYWVVKLDSNGQIEWQKDYGGSGTDILYSILSFDDGYLLSGVSASNISGDKTENSKGGGDYWIIRTDLTGNILWQKTIGGNSADIPYKALKVSDGYVFGGVSNSSISFDKTENNRGGYDYWLVKTDFDGNVLWDKTFGGDLDDYSSNFTSMIDGSGFVLVGTSYSGISGDKTVVNYGEYNGWVIRTNENGEMMWQKGIGGSTSDGFNQVIELGDGSILLGGGAISNVSGNLTVAGYGLDYWLVKLAPEELGTKGVFGDRLVVFPNPVVNEVNINFAEPQAKVSLQLYNSLMQEIENVNYANVIQLTHPLKFPSGIYFIKITNQDGEVFQTKILKS